MDPDAYTYWEGKVRIEVWVQNPAGQGFRLDQNTLDGMIPLLKPAEGAAFTLNTSKLGEGLLGPLGTQHVWCDLTPWATSIVCNSGLQDNAEMSPDAGDAEIRFRNIPDLTRLPVYAGTPLRIIKSCANFIGWNGLFTGIRDEVVWAGKVEDIAEVWDKTTTDKTTTLTAVDAIATLSDQLRYGARVGPETLPARVWRLLESSPYLSLPISWNPPTAGAAAPSCSTTVYEGPLTRHLSMAAATAGYLWTVTPISTNVLPGTEDPGGAVGESRQHVLFVDPLAKQRCQYSFTDLGVRAAGIHEAQTPRPYLGIELAGGTRAITSIIELTSHRIGNDGNADDVTTTHEDPTARAAWGARTGRIDATVLPGGEAQAARRILARSTDAGIRPVSIDLHGRHAITPGGGPPRVLDLVDVQRLGVWHHCIVTGIRHEWAIHNDPTPRIRHRTRLQLTRREPPPIMAQYKEFRPGEILRAEDINGVLNPTTASHIPRAVAAGTETMGSAQVQTVRFPSGRFTRPPIVTATVASGSGAFTWDAPKIINITATSFQIFAKNGTNVPINWIAIQMEG